MTSLGDKILAKFCVLLGKLFAHTLNLQRADHFVIALTANKRIDKPGKSNHIWSSGFGLSYIQNRGTAESCCVRADGVLIGFHNRNTNAILPISKRDVILNYSIKNRK